MTKWFFTSATTSNTDNKMGYIIYFFKIGTFTQGMRANDMAQTLL